MDFAICLLAEVDICSCEGLRFGSFHELVCAIARVNASSIVNQLVVFAEVCM